MNFIQKAVNKLDEGKSKAMNSFRKTGSSLMNKINSVRGSDSLEHDQKFRSSSGVQRKNDRMYQLPT